MTHDEPKYTADEVQDIVAGALYDFAARLTAQETPITFSCKHPAYPAINLLYTFANDRRLRLSNAKVKDWDFVCQDNKDDDVTIGEFICPF